MSEIRMLVDGVTSAWNNHDAAAFAAQFSEDSVLRIIATGEVMHGREELRADAEALLRAFPDLRMEHNSTYECGEAFCVIECTLTGTHEGEYIGIRPTHRLVELPACSIFTLGADRLVGEEVVYFDAATLLRQLGVLTEPADAQPSTARTHLNTTSRPTTTEPTGRPPADRPQRHAPIIRAECLP